MTVDVLRPVERSLTEVFFALNEEAEPTKGPAHEKGAETAAATGAWRRGPQTGWFGVFTDPTGNRVALYTSMPHQG